MTYFNRQRVLLGCLGCLLAITSCAQQRLADYNTLGWYTYNGDHKIGQRWAVHTEYQWRRIGVIQRWQQSLARLGLAYQLADPVQVAGGYTYFVTFPYGNYPQAAEGVPYPEHRLHQDIQLKSTYGRLALTHRFRLEERWIGQLADGNPGQISRWEFQNRARYQVAGEIPLQGATIDDGEWYVNFFDELFIGFGRNVGQNIYNQNRLSGGIGYQIKDHLKLELNYLYQVVQHADPDPVTQRPVFEYNNGFRLNVNYDLDFTSKKGSSAP